VSVVGAWSGTVSLVIHGLVLAMSRMGFIILSYYTYLYNGIFVLGLGCYGIIFTVLQYLQANNSVHLLSLIHLFPPWKL